MYLQVTVVGPAHFLPMANNSVRLYLEKRWSSQWISQICSTKPQLSSPGEPPIITVSDSGSAETSDKLFLDRNHTSGGRRPCWHRQCKGLFLSTDARKRHPQYQLQWFITWPTSAQFVMIPQVNSSQQTEISVFGEDLKWLGVFSCSGQIEPNATPVLLSLFFFTLFL